MDSHSEESLTILQWNCNGVRGRLNDIIQYAREHQTDVIVLQETLVGKDFNPRFSGYLKFSLPSGDRKPGLITYVSHNKPAQIIDDLHMEDDYESLGVTLYLNNNALHIINLYVPHSKLDLDTQPEFVNEEPTLLVGDLNARHPHFEDNCH
ncbi:exodeoxyribonuclease-like [Procambarus clarkii]|uniref:exodeoxyribonuclease-like n=1 Tax=Procambarus clarkii TaxID=6728 RepID=UPI00374219C9